MHWTTQVFLITHWLLQFPLVVVGVIYQTGCAEQFNHFRLNNWLVNTAGLQRCHGDGRLKEKLSGGMRDYLFAAEHKVEV